MFPDISEFQDPPYKTTPVDWNQLEQAYLSGQIEAVMIRASFGTVRADHSFATNQREGRARKIPLIYYHFCYPAFNSAALEAAFFNRTVGPLLEREAMAGDFEDDNNTPGAVFPRGPTGIDWAREFLIDLQTPINATWFYTYTSLFQEIPLNALLQTWPFWWADYGSRTDNPFGAIARQFTDAGSTPGVTGPCDQSRVLRTPLGDWLTPATAPTPPPEDTMPQEVIAYHNPGVEALALPLDLCNQLNCQLDRVYVNVRDHTGTGIAQCRVVLVGDDGVPLTSADLKVAKVGGSAEWALPAGAGAPVGHLVLQSATAPLSVTVKLGKL